MRQTYFCEDVSSIKERGGNFYLTDKSGDDEITRVMEYPVFARCVRGASTLLDEFEAKHGANIIDWPGH